MSTSQNEVEGSIIHIVHDDGETRTPLALTTTDDLGEFTPEEDSETASLTREHRSRRYRTHNEPTLEIGSLLAVNLDALELLGWVDTNGGLTTAPSHRRQQASSIRLEYYADEAADAPETTHVFEDVEVTALSIDPSATPPVSSWTWWIHGPLELDAPEELFVSSGSTYTIESGETESYEMTTIAPGGTLTQETDSTLNTTGY